MVSMTLCWRQARVLWLKASQSHVTFIAQRSHMTLSQSDPLSTHRIDKISHHFYYFQNNCFLKKTITSITFVKDLTKNAFIKHMITYYDSGSTLIILYFTVLYVLYFTSWCAIKKPIVVFRKKFLNWIQKYTNMSYQFSSKTIWPQSVFLWIGTKKGFTIFSSTPIRTPLRK